MENNHQENAQPLISIIVPVYNVAPYLPRCLDSILAQTHKNLEVILVNDGSTDNSGELCDYYCQKGTRIRVIHQENGGLSAARNTGMDVMQGEWFGFVDPDDYIEPQMYEKLLSAACGKQLAMCGYARHFLDGNRLLCVYSELPSSISGIQALEYFFGDKGTNPGWAVWNKLYKRELTEGDEFLRFDLECRRIQDALFNTHIMLKISEMAYVPEALYVWCMREDSLMNMPINDK